MAKDETYDNNDNELDEKNDYFLKKSLKLLNKNILEHFYITLKLNEKCTKEPELMVEALSCVLGNIYNLYVNFNEKQMVFKLGRSNYKSCYRYNLSYYSYNRFKVIYYSLLEYGYITTVKGDHDKHLSTTIYPTELFVDTFDKFTDIKICYGKFKGDLRLKDSNKNLINFVRKDTNDKMIREIK
jgi:hypothetical protein